MCANDLNRGPVLAHLSAPTHPGGCQLADSHPLAEALYMYVLSVVFILLHYIHLCTQCLYLIYTASLYTCMYSVFVFILLPSKTYLFGWLNRHLGVLKSAWFNYHIVNIFINLIWDS